MATETAIIKAEDYKIVKMDPALRAEIIRENLGALGVSQFDLDRAKIPSGSSAMFEVPTLSGIDMVDEIVGVIIGFRDVRLYWKVGMDEGGGGTPPDCYSDDCAVGIGDPGGNCIPCPFAEFGTADKGNGQACSQRRILFIARPGSTLPLVLSLPPTSLGNARKFFLRLVDNDVPYYGVVVSIGLETDKNTAGVAYSKATFKVAEILTDDLRAKFKAVKEEFAPHMSRAPISDGVPAAPPTDDGTEGDATAVPV